MRILITGSAGFIGYNLSKRLLSEGHSVIGIDNHNDDYDVSLKLNRTQELKEYEKFNFIKMDIVNDAFSSILSNEKIDYTVHLAAKDVYYESPDIIKYTPYLTTNVIGTSKIFELSKYLNAKKFVFSSTYSVYGLAKKPLLTEKKILPKPISPHGASKIAAEDVLHFMNNFYGLPAVILRMFSVYGPGMRPHTVIPLIIERLRRDAPIDLYSENTTRDYIYVDDVVEYIISTFNKRIKFQAINIATAHSTSISELAEKIARIMGKDPSKVKLTKHEKDFNKMVPQKLNVSIERAKKILRYTPKVSLDEGLEKTVNWYLANPEILYKKAHMEHRDEIPPSGNTDSAAKSGAAENETDWNKYYSDKVEKRFGGDYRGYHKWRLLENNPWIETIRAHIKPGDRVLEVGVGFGTVSIQLTKEGYLCTGMDSQKAIEQSVVNNAKKLDVDAQLVDRPQLSTQPGSLTLFQGDIRESQSIPQCDVIFNQGTLEHFSHEERLQILRNLIDKADTVIISVPTNWAGDPYIRRLFGLTVNKAVEGRDVGNIGNENFEKPQIYEELIAEAGGEIIQKGGYWVLPEIKDGSLSEVNLAPGVEVYARVSDSDGKIIKDNVFSLTVLHPRPTDPSKREDPEELKRCFEAAYDRSLLAFWVIKKKE